ncbi:HAMP domain-containing sensor histidine kinase [Oceanirhabdus seepicola]|uniref:histidine kinase n=1 Tax=Oceanirhabdus seepicola TaxID=2828781 RepID=A0A9J6P9V9_9CLOT|nr:HAMP domain-containing sensor histidine kinase [Oceanirhabdus seepicola]MCM1992836.1 HAMP domain-containing histidine kinase [Oceanirhabdus seepicola]
MNLVKNLSLGFLLTILISISITGFISNHMIDKKFDQYLMDEHKTKALKFKSLVTELYNEEEGFSESDFSEIHRFAMLEDFYIQVLNNNGEKIIETDIMNIHHKKMMEFMMPDSGKMKLGEYIEESYELISNGESIGKIIIGYYGTANLTPGGVEFKTTLNRSFFISVFIALIIGLCISIIIAKKIATPLMKIIKISNEMRKGNLEARVNIKSNTKEIGELSNSINYLAETLQKEDKLRKRLTADMAHEIRTPLTNVKTHIEALIDGIFEPTKERFESFYEEIERLIKLVEKLRDIAKLEEANLHLSKTEYNLSKDIEKVIDSFKPMFKKKDAQIISLIDQEVYVILDRDKLKQIMYNLISNAYKFIEKKGKVEVSLKEEKENIVIEVKDDGIGISEHEIPYIFERFYRSDTSRSKKTGGTGIGLTITKALIDAHKGSIEVTSKRGQGSIFTVKIPK